MVCSRDRRCARFAPIRSIRSSGPTTTCIVWAEGGRRVGHEIDRFTARIEEKRLVIEFSLPVTPPADPSKGPVSVSLFDRKNAVDFGFAPSGFLGVMGELKPGCKFRVARGKGEQSGHPRVVTLTCGG